jgi:uncharacterized protein
VTPRKHGSHGSIVSAYAGHLSIESMVNQQPASHHVTVAPLPQSRTSTNTRQLTLPARVALFALRFYKAYLSLLMSGSCRFSPTCSQFTYEAVERFGVLRGCWLGCKRLLRCQPLSRRFGFDPVPEEWPDARSGEHKEAHS